MKVGLVKRGRKEVLWFGWPLNLLAFKAGNAQGVMLLLNFQLSQWITKVCRVQFQACICSHNSPDWKTTQPHHRFTHTYILLLFFTNINIFASHLFMPNGKRLITSCSNAQHLCVSFHSPSAAVYNQSIHPHAYLHLT